MKIRFGSISYYLIAILITVLLILPSGTVVRSETMPASPGAPGADPDIWNLYTNANYINALAVEGNTLWAATSGGLVQWNISTGTYVKYHPTTSALSNASVRAVLVGAGGKKWIGTDYYVNTIDGATWATLTEPYQTRDIAVDASGNLWFATSGSGVKKFDGANWTTYNTSNSGIASNYTTAIAAEGNTIWIGTQGNGVSKFDGSSWTTYTPGSGTIQNNINDIAVAPNGTKWIAAGNDMGSSGGGGGSLTKLEGSALTSYTSANSNLISSYVFAVVVDASNTVYAGTELGVSKFNGSTWTSYTPADGLADRWVTSISINGSDLWFGTNGGGISRMSGAAWSTFKTADRLPYNSISAMGTQGENVWLSGASPFVINSFNGVTKYNGATWTDYRYGAGLTTPEVHAMAADSAGAMWFAGWDINKFDGAHWEKYEDPHGNGIAYALAIDGNDKWFYVAEPFGPGRWVSKFDGVNWSAYTTADGLVSTPVNSIAVDLDHSIWFATNNGVSKFSGSAWTSYTTASTANGLAHDKVYAVVVDKSGNKWFGTEGGVSKLSGTTWTTYKTADGLANNSVRAVSVDSAGSLWFGTYGGGVSKFASNSWTTYDTGNSGLASNYVYDMVITAADHKWIYTYQGVNEFYSPAPILEINYHTGAPGSFFNIAGRNFTPNQTARISVNNQYVGSVSIDAGGAFTTTLTTSADTDPGYYFITASYTPSPLDLRQPRDPTAPGDQTATVRFLLDAGQPVRAKEGAFSIINIPDGISRTLIFVPGVRK